MARKLPITELIESRIRDLHIRRGDMASRAGRKNGAKLLRQLDALMQGDIASARGLIEVLPLILEVPASEIESAIADTKRILADEAEASWRADFLPHGIIMTERERPTQIFPVALIGADRLLRIDLDMEKDESTYVSRTLERLDERIRHWEAWRGEIPFFGAPTGFVINFSPDRATRYDLKGHPLEHLPAARRLGHGVLSFT